VAARGDRILAEDAGLISLDPQTDQIARDVVALRRPMEHLAGEKLLSDLALEFDAVGTMSDHGLPSFDSPPGGQIIRANLSDAWGPIQSGVRPQQPSKPHALNVRFRGGAIVG
jgi:hypothetical protein